jgi:hypothetical protein
MRVNAQGSAKDLILKEIPTEVEMEREQRLGCECTLQVFCKRVRKTLIEKKLLEPIFLKSAQEFENAGVILVFFLQRTEPGRA